MVAADDALALIVRAAEEDGFGAHSVHVLVADDEARHHWGAEARRDVHSITKGVCVLAAGMAVDRGLFDLDAPVVSYLPDCSPGPGVVEVTTRHLLAMSSGIDLPWTPTWATDWPDLAREYLSRPSAGRVFQYSPASTYTAMRALATVVGDVAAWTDRLLLGPLDIDGATWDRCPSGWVLAAEGLRLRADELARLGRLIRDGGTWGGHRVLSPRWPEAMSREWTWHEAPPHYARYSLGAWGGPGDAWRLHGAHGQLVIFWRDAVVTITADDHAGADHMAARAVDALRHVCTGRVGQEDGLP